MTQSSSPLAKLGLGALAALVGVGLWLGLTPNNPAPASPPTPQSTALAPGPSDAATLQKGEYLARIGNCAFCHTTRGGEPYAGGRAIETPFGAVLSSNITPDKMYGIGQWTADDFWQALHHGKSRDGRLLYPAFPYTSYTRVSRQDADALFAYLQQLPAATRPNEAHRLRWPYSTTAALWVWRTLNFNPAEPGALASNSSGQGVASASAAPASATPSLERGAYLVDGLGHCQECHSARNRWGAMTTEVRGSVLSEGRWVAPSLRTSAEAGVGAWSEGEIVSFLTSGTSAKASAMGPMAEVVLHGTQYLTDSDAKAMAAYLRSIDNGAQASPAAPQTAGAAAPAGAGPIAGNGEKIYQQQCADCHGAQGEGRLPAYPALAGNRAVNLAQPNNLIHALLHGGFPPATRGNPRPYGMPPFMLRLDDRQGAEVLSYIRAAWGNTGAPVSEFDINSLRR